MHAADELNGPTYAHEILTADEIVTAFEKAQLSSAPYSTHRVRSRTFHTGAGIEHASSACPPGLSAKKHHEVSAATKPRDQTCRRTK